MSIAAVVVTYKRPELLKKCIESIFNQSKAVEKIYLVDNSNEKDAAEVIAQFSLEKRNKIIYIPLKKNIGGAGGFHVGLKQAYEDKHDWLWIMDDDTCAEQDAVQSIFNVIETNHFGLKVFASAVYWQDEEIHSMNYPTVRWQPYDLFNKMADQRLIPIRHASFVSLFIAAECIKKYGLPMYDYFIWNEDAEYSARILKNELGALVLDSKVFHLTATKNSQIYEAHPDRFFFEIRNKIWMILFSQAWFWKEKIKLAGILGDHIIKFLKYNNANFFKKTLVVFHGMWRGICNRPQK